MSPAQVKAFRDSLNLSASRFALAIGLTGEDAGRTIRRWEAEPESVNNWRPPPPWLATFEAAAREVPGFRDWLIARGRGAP